MIDLKTHKNERLKDEIGSCVENRAKAVDGKHSKINWEMWWAVLERENKMGEWQVGLSKGIKGT